MRLTLGVAQEGGLLSIAILSRTHGLTNEIVFRVLLVFVVFRLSLKNV